MSVQPSVVSHQNVRLSKGQHSSPDSGACVMELASMLAGEEFSDRPQSACPVIGQFLRTYNDSLDDDRRQDLYGYAAKVVGTRGSAELEEARRQRCREWAAQMRMRVTPRLARGWERLRPEWWKGASAAAGVEAARTVRSVDDERHALALAFVDELVAMSDGAAFLADARAAAAGRVTTDPVATDAADVPSEPSSV